MANHRELNYYHNHSYEDLVDLIIELTDKSTEYEDKIRELEREISDLTRGW